MDSGFESSRSDPDVELSWLLQLCLDGEAAAFEELVDKLYPRLFSVLIWMGVQGKAAHAAARQGFSAALLSYRGDQESKQFISNLIQNALYQINNSAENGIGEDTQKQQVLAQALRDHFQYSPEQTALFLELDPEFVRRLLEPEPDREAADQARLEVAGSEPVLTRDELHIQAERIFAQFMEQRLQQRRRVRLVEVGWVVLVISLMVGGAYLLNRLTSGLPGLRNSTAEAPAGSPVYLGLLADGIGDPADEMFVALNPALDGPSSSPKLSADGNTLAFVSGAANLVPHDTNQETDIFLYDRLADRIERINAGQDGLQADQESLEPVISDDGRYTAFISWAGNLDPRDYGICPGTSDANRSCADIFLFDRKGGSLERILPFEGANGRGHTGVYYKDNAVFPTLAISGDGRYLAFHADVSNPGYITPGGGLFIYDLKSNETWQVDRDASGKPAHGLSHSPAFSGDGRYLAFIYQGSSLGDNSPYGQIFLYDLQAGTLRQVTQGMSGGGANADVHSPVLSQDGRYLAFTTAADNLVPGDRNEQEDVFLHDSESGATQLISLSPGLVQADQSSQEAALAAGGDIIAYRSLAGSLVAGDTNGTWDIFVFDRLNNTLELASLTVSSAAADGPSSQPSLSADGRYLAFVSAASNLVGGDRNGLPDVFLLDRATGELIWVSASGSGMQVALPAVLGPRADIPTPRAVITQIIATPTRTPLVTIVILPTATQTTVAGVSSTPTLPVFTPTPPGAYPPPQPTLPLPTITSAYPTP